MWLFVTFWAVQTKLMVADWKAFLYSHNYCSCKFRNGDLFCIRCKLTFFQLCLDIFSTLVPIDNLLHYSAYTPKKSAFYANWFGNAKQLNKKWKILKEIHFFNSASAFFQLWLRMCFSKNPFPCVPFLWKNQLPIPAR